MRRVLPVFLFLNLAGTIVLAQGDFQKGISYYKQGQYEKAIQEFEKIVADDPNYESGYRVLGDSYLKLKRWEQASRAFARAITLNNQNFSSFYGAAVAEFNLGRYSECVTNLLRGERQAKTPQEQYQLYRLRGSAYYNGRRFKEAAADLEKAVQIRRGDYRDALQLGISYFQIGNIAGARQYLEQATALNPSADEPKQFLSRLVFQEAIGLIQTQRYAEAVTALTQYVQSHPNEGEAWYNLGLASALGKNWDGAEKAFVRAAELLPGKWEVFSRFGYVLEMKKRYLEALKNYQRAYELRPDPAQKEDVDRLQERIRREKQGSGN